MMSSDARRANAAAPRPGRWVRWVRAGFSLAVLLPGIHGAAGADLYDIAPATPARVVGPQYFGTHFHRLLPVSDSGERATPWPAGQIGALRLWDSSTRWSDLEPSRGSFRFDRLDAYVARAQDEGASLLMVLGSAPRWAAARPDEPGPYGPGSASEPADLEDWDRYVAALARRYKGRVEAYELWNEPYFSDLPADRNQATAFFTGSVASMVELARRARAVLDREDPKAVLLTPGFVGGVQRFDMFLRAGGGRHVGGVAYHYYVDDDREFIKLHRDIRAVMTRHGLSWLPLYNTESGFASQGDGADAAGLLAHSMVLGAFLGIDRFYQYAWDNGRSGMVLPLTLQPTPSAAAFAAVRRWLVGTTLLGCHLEPAGTVRCEGARNGENLLIAWRAEGNSTIAMRLPASAQMIAAEHAVDRKQLINLRAVLDSGVVAGTDPVAVWWRPSNSIERVAP